MKWIKVEDGIPQKPCIIKVKLEDGQVFDGLVCRNGRGEWTIQPWDEDVKFWKKIAN